MRSFLAMTVGLSAISSGFALSAATISTSASCYSYAGNQIVHGSSVATCNISAPDGSGASGTAESGGSIIWPDAVIVVTEAVTSPPHSVYAPAAIVNAVYDDDLTFEISGASGAGTVVPLLSVFAGVGQEPGGAWATASLGSVSISANDPNGPSGFVPNGYSFPFLFGVPFTVHFHLESNAVAYSGTYDLFAGGSAWARFDGFKNVQLDGEIVPNAVITQITTPEPSTFALGVIGMGFVWFASRRATRAH